MVPNGWEFTTFETHIDLLSGFAFKSAEYTVNNDDIRLLRGDNIAPNTLRWNGVKTWDKHQYAELKKYHLREYDFVIAMDRTWVSSGLKVAEVTKNDLPCLLVQRVARIRALPTLEQSLLRQYFSSHRFEQYVKGVQTETAVPHISSKQIKEFPLLLPPLPEQRKIALILSTWDKAIATTEKLIETSKQQKKALMQQLLTGKKRLRSSPKDGAERGKVFEGEWNVQEIGNLLKEVKRPVAWNDDADYRLLSVKRRSEGIVLREVLKGYNILTKKMNLAKEGDFLISKMQVVHGASGLVTSEFDHGHISGSYIALVPKKSDLIDIEFFSWLSKQKKMYHQAFLCSYGVHIEKMTFNFKLYLKAEISLPSDISEQQKIASVLTAADKEIELLQAKLAHFKQEKKALMQQLLTGKRRVKVDETEAA